MHQENSAQIKPIPIDWNALDPKKRGPIVTVADHPDIGNAFGTHGGQYAFQIMTAKAIGLLNDKHIPDLSYTEPEIDIEPNDRWNEIVSFDPFGHRVMLDFKDLLDKGVRIFPTISVIKSSFKSDGLLRAIEAGQLSPDGKLLTESGIFNVTEIAINPVWYLPGIARRLQFDVETFRFKLNELSGGQYELFNKRPALDVLLPPMGEINIQIFGDVHKLKDPFAFITARPHDSCFDGYPGSTRCTCDCYLDFAIEECIKTAQYGGVGLLVHYSNEGRGFGHVAKTLVYQKREHQPDGDIKERYFECSREVMGGFDARLFPLVPDVFRWLGVKKIDRWLAMSAAKYSAMKEAGIQIKQQVSLPSNSISATSLTELMAKIDSGYWGMKD